MVDEGDGEPTAAAATTLYHAFSMTWAVLSFIIIMGSLTCTLIALLLPDALAFRAAQPILSNGAFLLAAMEAWHGSMYTTMMLYLFIVISSSMYHSCYAFGNTCHMDPLMYQFADFFFAQLVIPLTALHIIRFTGYWIWLKRLAICAFAFVIAFAQHVLGRSLYVQIIIGVVSLLLIVTYWTIYNIVGKLHATPEAPYKWELVPDIYDWTYFGYGITLTCIACALFTTQMQSHRLYWAIHSCWHNCAALAQYYVLKIHRVPFDPVKEGYTIMDSELTTVASKFNHHRQPRKVPKGPVPHKTTFRHAMRK
jgi:hypothetical protein